MSSPGEDKIINTLMEAPTDIQGIVEKTYLSESYIRLQLKYMEKDGRVEKADRRVPYVYRIPIDSPIARQKESVAKIKKDLLAADKSATITEMVLQAPKQHWAKVAEELEATAIAIRELETEGKLVETL